MNHLWGDLRKRHQDEGALRQTRVWQGQVSRLEDFVANQEEIEIERAWSVREGAGAAQVALDAEQRAEEVGGRQRGLQRDDRVEKARLLQVSDRLSLVETRDRGDASKGLQPLHRRP